MKSACVLVSIVVLLSLSVVSQAVVSISTVRVGDAGNAADTRAMTDGTTGYGSVDYDFDIGKYEVTAGQYTEFLNAKAKADPYLLYSSWMWSDVYGCKIQRTGTSGNYSYSVAPEYANRPVNYVTFWDACRFVNWLQNGQGNGDTEAGAYTLNGFNSNDTDGLSIGRNVGWKWALPSEDEWHKAAYYENGTYSLYANGTGTAPVKVTDSNYGGTSSTWDGSVNGTTEQNGTRDMMGNVWEWNESVIGGAYRGWLGGSFLVTDSSTLRASWRGSHGNPAGATYTAGFRVVQAVPEPSSLVSLAMLGAPLLALRRRKA